MQGDFSSSVEEMKEPDGKYYLYTNNCSQVSLRILSISNTQHSDVLSSVSKCFYPEMAFNLFEIKTIIKMGNIEKYIWITLNKLLS